MTRQTAKSAAELPAFVNAEEAALFLNLPAEAFRALAGWHLESTRVNSRYLFRREDIQRLHELIATDELLTRSDVKTAEEPDKAIGHLRLAFRELERALHDLENRRGNGQALPDVEVELQRLQEMLQTLLLKAR